MSYYPDRLLQTSDLAPFYASGHAHYNRPDPSGLNSNAFYRGSYRGYPSEPGPTGVATDLSGAALGSDATPYDSYIYPPDETVRSASVHMNPSVLQSTYYPNSEAPSCPQTFQSLSGSGEYPHSRRASVSPPTPCKKTASVGLFYRSHIIDDLSCMTGSADQLLAMEPYPGGTTQRGGGAAPSMHFATPGASAADHLGQTVTEISNIGEGYFDGRRYDQPPQQQHSSRVTDDTPDREGVSTESGGNHGFGLHAPPGARRPPQEEDQLPADSSSSSSSSSSQQQAGQCPSSGERNDGGSRIGGGAGLGGLQEEVKAEESGEDPNGFRTRRNLAELDRPESESSGDSIDGDTPEEEGRLPETNGLDGAAPMFPWMKLHHGEYLSVYLYTYVCLTAGICLYICIAPFMS